MSETLDPNLRRWALSVDETAVVLGVSRAHAYRMVRAGVLPSIRLGGRILVPVDRLREQVLDGSATAIAAPDASVNDALSATMSRCESATTLRATPPTST